MRRLRYILLAFALVAAAACEEEHDLKLDNQDQRLCLQCIPGLSDTTVVILKAATPITQKDSIAPDISNATVIMKINGKDAPLYPSDSVIEDAPAGSYYHVGRLSEGDKVEVEASIKGIEPIYAKTVMPAPLGALEMEYSLKGSDDRYLYWDIDLSSGGKEEYYAVQVSYRTTAYREYWPAYFYDEEGRVVKDTSVPAEYVRDTTLNVGNQYLQKVIDNEIGLDVADEIIDVSFYGYSLLDIPSGAYSRLSLIPGSMLDSDGHLRFYTSYWNGNYEYEDYFEDGSLRYHSIQETDFKVSVYRLSPEFYRFAKSRYDVNNNILGEYGLAPASFTYTNVRGGFGVLGAASKTETDWFVPGIE